ncbi:MAG TPA: prolyl oligopeptidase family serine peptidase [Candidatus Saccharimonadaceae bacterium]|jgi:prolyl oligopeptidase|nr:prolyl oligopeptidase family serine peptidase [Candidatus Saccharimonadaceae bacterium]
MNASRTSLPWRPLGAAALLTLVMLTPTANARPAYPPSTQQPVADTLHGTVLVDPYRWLEDGDSQPVHDWTTAQNAFTRSVLDVEPGRDALRERLRALYAVTTTSEPVVRGKRLFYSRHTGTENQPVVMVRDEAGAGRVALDPNALSADGTVALDWMYVSPDGARFAYGTSSGGSEQSTLRVRDVDGKDRAADVIPHTAHASVAWDPDGQGFLYTRHPAKGEVPPGEEVFHEQVFHHKLGDDPAKDPLVWGGEGRPMQETRTVSLSSDKRWVFLQLSTDWAKNDLLARPAAGGEFQPLAVGLDGIVNGDSWNGTLYLLTNVGASRYHIVKADPARPGPTGWAEVVPEQKGVIEDFQIVGGHLALRLSENATSRIALFSLDGKFERDVPLPALGSVAAVAADPASSTLYLTFASFAYPGTLYRFDLSGKAIAAVEHAESPVRPADYLVRQEWVTSKDGTKVPVFLVHRRALKMDGQRPTLLTGYGGFNVSETPAYRADMFPWLDAGGVYASVCLRGGGEFGREWHEAGRLEHKQNVFDDFHATAEWLIHSGITRSDKLAARGGSNGGLLMGAVETQRPDLYGAIVCQAPLLDMIRYQNFLIARYWVPEYGSSENADQFKYLLAYSPYQNVHDGTRYPATLITTAEEDSRVDPLHARKMAARLQAASGGDAPILIRIESKAGHGQGKPISKRIDESVDILSFLFGQLHVTPSVP